MNLPVWPNSDDPDYGPQPSSIELTKRMQHFNKTLEHFWKRWRTKYLVELRESHRYQTQTRKGTSIVSVGDVVIVQDQDQPRGLWKLAIVKEVLTGSDGHIRGAVVRVHSKANRLISLRRSVRHLYH